MQYRILVTGSRNWDDYEIIRAALEGEVYLAYANGYTRKSIVQVNGACPTGADEIAASMFITRGYEVEEHPADWEKYGKRAGFLRNTEMVESGVDVCLAFIRNGSRGATMTAKMADTVGIPVKRYEINDAIVVNES